MIRVAISLIAALLGIASTCRRRPRAMVDDNVVVVDSISMRVIDIIRGAAHE